jgi:hypothetical protein
MIEPPLYKAIDVTHILISLIWFIGISLVWYMEILNLSGRSTSEAGLSGAVTFKLKMDLVHFRHLDLINVDPNMV